MMSKTFYAFLAFQTLISTFSLTAAKPFLIDPKSGKKVLAPLVRCAGKYLASSCSQTFNNLLSTGALLNFTTKPQTSKGNSCTITWKSKSPQKFKTKDSLAGVLKTIENGCKKFRSRNKLINKGAIAEGSYEGKIETNTALVYITFVATNGRKK
ncbi:hypothetical protein BY996DRAFT_109253 [Phakopsora pachyrhizi]|uniref:Secreted protein n=1 Tax=Phakopsora pachyrhizi TaxID=170000 RepID=A0AAV0AFJ6_PHAPC|nr:hypothetical protein BY996DRAFT_109253 [Phakopsora pachyrhizi]CAH7665946.1 hypothetical protein PPACK8108_LOCUS244 [Phakopsora pachyrhizi]